MQFDTYRQVSNISRTLAGNKIVEHSDVVGASPVGAAPTTSSFSTLHMASLEWAKTSAWRYENHLSLVRLILEILRYIDKFSDFSICRSLIWPCQATTDTRDAESYKITTSGS